MWEEIVAILGYPMIVVAVILMLVSLYMMTSVSSALTFWIMLILFGITSYMATKNVDSDIVAKLGASAFAFLVGWAIGGLINMANNVDKAQRKVRRWLDEE